jgi:hypothetical protein
LEGESQAEFTPGSATAIPLEFLLPLTIFISNPVLELYPLLISTEDQEQTRNPIVWQLSSQGVIIEITPELLGL